MQPFASNGRPLPFVTPIARPFFEAARANRLLLQHCPRDGFFFFPRSHCPHCLHADWVWKEARDKGVIHAFTIDRVGHDPAQRARTPFALALVDLADGPRIVGTIAECAVEDVRIGMPVIIRFEIVDEMPLVTFAPDPGV